MEIYISGKISGLPVDEAKAAFNKAVNEIEALGHTPISPFDDWLGESASWEEHMKHDIKIMLSCDAIYMLSNWEGSKGARIEWYIAQQINMKIMYETNKRSFSKL